MTIWFDMDGTIANLYSVDGWLDKLRAEDPTPYMEAEPLLNLQRLARKLNRLQAQGYQLGIVSWTAKVSSELYCHDVTAAKLVWLERHLQSVSWDYIEIVPYGTPKGELCKEGILFDDELNNRMNWCNEQAFEPSQIFDVLSALMA